MGGKGKNRRVTNKKGWVGQTLMTEVSVNKNKNKREKEQQSHHGERWLAGVSVGEGVRKGEQKRDTSPAENQIKDQIMISTVT